MTDEVSTKVTSLIEVKECIARARLAIDAVETASEALSLPARERTALSTRANKLRESLKEMEIRATPKPTKSAMVEAMKNATPEQIARALEFLQKAEVPGEVPGESSEDFLIEVPENEVE